MEEMITSLQKSGVAFFIGAGASRDYGFPLGLELAKKITKDLSEPNKSELGKYLLRFAPFKEPKLKDFSQELSNSVENQTYSSIDAFLESYQQTYPHFVEIGRHAVWCTILKYEKKSNLNPPEVDWIDTFFSRYLIGLESYELAYSFLNPVKDPFFPEQAGLIFYLLNYDRLLEKKLLNFLVKRFPKDEEQIRKDMGNFITHPHGSLGRIEGDDNIAYGSDWPISSDKLKAGAGNLRFWFEKSPKPEPWDRMNAVFQNKGCLCFLGYGYHSQINSRFGLVDRNDSRIDSIYASAFGLNDSQREQQETWLKKTFEKTDSDLFMGMSHQSCYDIIINLPER